MIKKQKTATGPAFENISREEKGGEMTLDPDLNEEPFQLDSLICLKTSFFFCPLHRRGWQIELKFQTWTLDSWILACFLPNWAKPR